MKRLLSAAVLVLLASACGGGESSDPMTLTPPRITRAAFGTTADGRPVDIITLRNGKGAEMTVLTYGGIIQTLKMPDRTGAYDDIVMGFDTLAEYEKSSTYFGSLIGRVGNRIAKGTFTLDGKTYTLAKNNGPNHLHGGLKGCDKVVWKADPFQDRTGVRVRLEYTTTFRAASCSVSAKPLRRPVSGPPTPLRAGRPQPSDSSMGGTISMTTTGVNRSNTSWL